MYLTLDEVKQMNAVQLEIFKEFVKICDKYNLKYYMIHGSLLGTLRCNGFFPFDDDIDVAMPRKDYDVLIEKASKELPDPLFIQSHKTEAEYPLAFAKIRNSETSFIQTVLNQLNVNKGIYIDIFPLDNYPESKFKQKFLKMREKILSTRISTRLTYAEEQPVWKKMLRAVSLLLHPSWNTAVRKRAELYSNIPEGNLFITVNGKPSERGIPSKWFLSGKTMTFEGMEVICTKEFEKYLTCIYGDYIHYNPAEKYMNADNCVEVSAEKFSVTQSYKSFEKNN